MDSRITSESCNADAELSAEALREKYVIVLGEPEHPAFEKADWQESVAAGDTEQGYWDWVVANLEETSIETTPSHSGAM